MEVKQGVPGRNPSVACWAKKSEGVGGNCRNFALGSHWLTFESKFSKALDPEGRMQEAKGEVESRKWGICAQYSFRKSDLKRKGTKVIGWYLGVAKPRTDSLLPSPLPSFLLASLLPSLPLSLPLLSSDFPHLPSFPFLTSFFLLFLLLFYLIRIILWVYLQY